jgi:hypothetical protein
MQLNNATTLDRKSGERSGGTCGSAAPSSENVLLKNIPKEVLPGIASFLFKSHLNFAVRLYAYEGLGC